MLTLHAENTKYNKVLSKAYQNHGSGRIELYLGGEVFLLEPDEVIEKLKETGINISRKTLYNWEQWGLIPQAVFRNSRRTEYPEHTWAESYASEKLRKGPHRINKEPLKDIRTLALKVEDQGGTFYIDQLDNWTKAGFAVEWIKLKHSKLLPNCKCAICKHPSSSINILNR